MCLYLVSKVIFVSDPITENESPPMEAHKDFGPEMNIRSDQINFSRSLDTGRKSLQADPFS